MKNFNLFNIAFTALICFTMMSCEKEEVNSNVCSPEFNDFQSSDNFISKQIATTNADEELRVKQVDMWVMSNAPYYVFSVANGAREIDERVVYKCDQTVYRHITEEEWQEFKDSDVFRSALYVDQVY